MAEQEKYEIQPRELQAARHTLKITANDLARILHMKGKHSAHTIKRWEAGTVPIPPYVGIIIDLALSVPGAFERMLSRKIDLDADQ